MNGSEMQPLQLKKYNDLINVIGKDVELTESEKNNISMVSEYARSYS